MLKLPDVNLFWLGHDGFRLEASVLTVYIDPFKLSAAPKPASVVLLTHEHFDHCSIEDLRKVVTPKTIIVCPNECLSAVSKLKPGDLIPIAPGAKKEVLGVTVQAVPAYNTNKYRDAATKTLFHPKQDEKVGYLVTVGMNTIYHAGDTDAIPEMQGISCDVALLPVSGTYVMTPDEAAKAAAVLKPKLAVPMHYGAIVGTEADAQKFKELATKAGIRAEVLKKES